MRIFKDLSPVGAGDTSLVNIVNAVIPRLYSLPAPRSLCELNMDEEDYQWICRWARLLSESRVRRWLDDAHFRSIELREGGGTLTYAEAFGCIFLLLASEIARREAREGSVWPEVWHKFPSSVDGVLFDYQRQPKYRLKWAMEDSAKKLNLRHVYDIEGTQEYYVSVYLQFGFTQNGIDRLPFWLSGQIIPESIQYLSGMRGDYLRSASFIELWDALRNLRRKNIPEAHARWILEHNPWVNPIWADEIVEKATERISGDYDDGTDFIEDDQVPLEFLVSPRLIWDGVSEPHFSSSVFNLVNLGLTSDRYTIRSDDTILARLYGSDFGSYRPEPTDIRISPHSPNFTATIVDGRGEVVASQFIDLWDPMEDVELFNLETGKWLEDPWGERLTSGRDYGLLISEDLSIEPSFPQFSLVGRGETRKKIFRIRVRENSPVRVLLDGQELWTSRSGSVRSQKSRFEESAWARSANVRLHPSNTVNLDDSEMTSLYVFGLDDDTVLNYIRAGSLPLHFEKGTGGYTTQEFNVIDFALPRSGSYELAVRLGLRKGNDLERISRTLVLDASGVVRMSSGDKREVVDPHEPLSVHEAGRYVYKVVVRPEFIDQRVDLQIVEGTSVVGRFPIRPRPLRSLAGYGERLWVSRPVQPQRILTISGETHDTGVLTGLLSTRFGKSRLYLHHSLEPGKDHQILFWKPGSSPEIHAARDVIEHSNESYTEWDVSHSSFSNQDTFLGIAYCGERVGAWWPKSVHAISFVPEAMVLETFAMLRWLHAPILAQQWREAVLELIVKYRDQVFDAWVEDRGLSDGMKQKEADRNWMTVVGRLERETNNLAAGLGENIHGATRRP